MKGLGGQDLACPRYDSHRLIEEYMIAANVAAAEALQAQQAPVMYRIHEPPALGDVETLHQIAFDTRFQAGAGGSPAPKSLRRHSEPGGAYR